MIRVRQLFHRRTIPATRGRAHAILFLLILALGIFARTWDFGQLPPGVDIDEASTAVDAYDLYKYGVDRNGIAFPVEFVSWGEGQSVLYGYLLIPFFAAMKQLDPVVVRLPMLLAGIASLPLVYLLGKALLDARLGLLSMFFLAISPWHILMSRWAKEASFLPFVFLAGFVCLLKASKEAGLFILGCALLALCLYAHGTAYVLVPVFFLFAGAIIVRKRIVSARYMVLGLCVFVILAAPIAALILVNTLHLHPINFGPITIPRLPVRPRYENQTVIGNGAPNDTVTKNLIDAAILLFTQSDGIVSDVLEPYGYFYTITFPLALLGMVILFQFLGDAARSWEASLMLAWLGASIPVAMLLPAGISRLNFIFIPLIVCMALSVHWLSRRLRPALPIGVCILLVAFTGFTIAYHGPAYRRQLDGVFSTGLLPALDFAGRIGDGPICAPGSGYVYVLFAEHQNPAIYLRNIKYDRVRQPNRRVISSSRYTFGLDECRHDPATVYVNLGSDPPPAVQAAYESRTFENFVVYYPSHR